MNISALTFAVALAQAAPTGAEVPDEIEAANGRWTEAVTKKDMAALEALLAPEFVLTSGAATAKDSVPRALWLQNLGRIEIGAYETKVTGVAVRGDIAVATVTGSWTVSLGGQKRNDRFTLRDVWVRRAQRWQVVRRYIVGE